MIESSVKSKYIIDIFSGNPGRKFIVIGGIHGNEKAGITAIEGIIPELRKHFLPEKGSIYFLKGNIPALEKNERFIDKDLNRLWTNEYIRREQTEYADEKVLKELHSLIMDDICRGDTAGCTFMDLHTFSAESGIFCIPSGSAQSVETARSFGVPFIEKLASNLTGTTLEYFGSKGMNSIVFEGGTHGTPAAVQNLTYALWHMLAYLGMVSGDLPQVTESRRKLREISRNYPHHLELVYHHSLDKFQDFKMNDGYYNFKPIRKSEVLAVQNDRYINAPFDGYILMPLYQKKGSDGFFIVKDKD